VSIEDSPPFCFGCCCCCLYTITRKITRNTYGNWAQGHSRFTLAFLHKEEEGRRRKEVKLPIDVEGERKIHLCEL